MKPQAPVQIPLASVDGQSRDVVALYEHEAEQLERHKQDVLSRLADLRHGKSVYDAHFPWWAKHIFGEASYAHEVVKKALRAASLVASGVTGMASDSQYADTLEDTLYDLLNFVVMWLSWRRFQREEAKEDESSTHRPGTEY